MILFFLVTAFVLIIYVVLLIYYRNGWNQLSDFQPATINPGPATYLTVIIPARNEALHLPALLDSIDRQTYSKKNFEVLLIDDHSTDDTAAIASAYSFVTCLSLKDFVGDAGINSYKKKAIEIGIQNSRGKLIITTDADCMVPEKWLETIAAFYEEKKPAFIVMPVSVNCSARPIEIFQALDFMSLQGITAAAVHKKAHSMCNGANLAYSRNAFEAVAGFKGIDAIASGDDMLLLHKIALQYPNDIHYLRSKNVIVQTAAVNTIKDFLNQRIRWASKAGKYDDKTIFLVLLIVYLLNVLLLILPLVSMAGGCWRVAGYSLVLIAFKTIAELIFLYPVAKFFGKQQLLWTFPLAQPFHIVYTVIAGWLGQFGSYQWKERKVK